MMRVILFQDRFAKMIRTGTKMQTIRGTARCKPGDSLSLRRWTGRPYQSKQETLLTTRCASVLPVRISGHGIRVEGCGVNRDRMAAAEGFRDWPDMRQWFAAAHGLPFNGSLISWRYPGQTNKDSC